MRGKYAPVFAALTKAGIEAEQRAEMINNFTDGRTSSLKEMSDMEVREFAKAINGLGVKNRRAEDVLRKKIIWLLCSMGYMKSKKTGEMLYFTQDRQPNGRPNMVDIYKVIYRLGYKHKSFNAYTVAELPKLVTQFEQIRKNNWNAEANLAAGDFIVNELYANNEDEES